MRRYLIIGAIAIVLIGLVAVGYFYFFASTAGVSVGTTGDTNFPSSGAVGPSDTGDTQTGPVTVPNTANKVTQRLVQIDKSPVVSGMIALDVLTTTALSSTTPDIEIRYLARRSGNVFSYLFRASALTRISNRTIPAILEAKWLPSGTTAFVRYLSGEGSNTINTYALPAAGSAGFFLAQNISGLEVASTTLLALASGTNGSVASTIKPSGASSATLFSTPLSQIRLSFLGKQYLAFTKGAAGEAGYAFSVNSAGSFSRIAGPLSGLVALASPQGNWVLVSYAQSGVLKMELVNVATRAVLQLPVATIADKCAWASDETAIYCGVPISPSTSSAYPDDWYQGAISFNDKIWKINVAGRYAELVLDFPEETGQALDATDVTLDPKKQVLVFKNKIDGSLWAYQL